MYMSWPHKHKITQKEISGSVPEPWSEEEEVSFQVIEFKTFAVLLAPSQLGEVRKRNGQIKWNDHKHSPAEYPLGKNRIILVLQNSDRTDFVDVNVATHLNCNENEYQWKDWNV